jgi:hypothetical protein
MKILLLVIVIKAFLLRVQISPGKLFSHFTAATHDNEIDLVIIVLHRMSFQMQPPGGQQALYSRHFRAESLANL